MNQPQQNRKNILQPGGAIPRFSVRNVCAPQFNIEALGTAPGGFLIPALSFLPFTIKFPGTIERPPPQDPATGPKDLATLPKDLNTGLFEKGSRFTEYALTALKLEREIVRCIRGSKSKMMPSVAEAFEVDLLQRSTVQNMLRRLGGLCDEKQQLVPGLYLGSQRADPGLGDVLCVQIAESYTYVKKALPRKIPELCAKWGEVQSKARSEIIEASWAQLVNRGSWPVPLLFEENMGFFLEGQLPPLSSDAFGEWFAHIECLSKSKKSLVLDGCKNIRQWISNDESLKECDRAKLMDELSELDQHFPRWGEFRRDLTFLRNPSSVKAYSLVEELFPDLENRPFHVEFFNATPHRLVISEQQALDWGSFYLTHCDPREITIRYSSEPGDSAWQRMRRTPEVQVLANSPIIEFISRVEFDCFALSRESCLEMFENQLKLLKAFEENDAWRNTNYARTVEVLFTNASHRGDKDCFAALRESCQELRPMVGELFEQWTLCDEEARQGASSSATLRLTWQLEADPDCA